jgi:hypothetical protein
MSTVNSSLAQIFATVAKVLMVSGPLAVVAVSVGEDLLQIGVGVCERDICCVGADELADDGGVGGVFGGVWRRLPRD